MELCIKHVFANVLHKGRETDGDIEYAWDANGCPSTYNVGQMKINNHNNCSHVCISCFNQTMESTRLEGV